GGAYIVRLTVTNDCGTDVQTMQVTITGAPVANFSANVTSGCAPLVVQYTNQSSGSVSGFQWVFQGGSPATSTNSNPLVTYNTPGVYDVTLTVSNSAGSDTEFRDNFITVLDDPLSDFDFNVNGNQVTFTNLSGNATSSLWEFGDGLTGNDTNPIHFYAVEGVYTVILYSTGPCGIDSSSAIISVQSPPSVNFSFTQSGQCAPTTVQFTNQSSENVTGYKWTFEGGSPSISTVENPLVSYNTPGTYDVQLIVFAPAGSDTLDMPNAVTVGVGPDAIFLFATNGTTVDFENLSTNATTYEWLFGDGQFSNLQNPSHTYSGFGTYIISLIATSDCGEDTMNVEIILGTNPNAFFTFTDNTGCAPFDVQFIDQSQNNPTSWAWTFEGGNPSTSNQQNPVVSYSTPGFYMVTLQVTNGSGTDVLVLDDLIHVANLPDATFDYSGVGNLVSLNYFNTDYDSLRWDFGDGRTDQSLNPIIEYSSNGQYTISLIVYNACGSDTSSVAVNIMGTSTNNPDENISRWQLRPNPFSDLMIINGIPAAAGKATILVYDVHGKLILHNEFSHDAGEVNFEINTTQLSPGMVLIQIRDNNSTVILKGVHEN
ncbi:MAG: PKD domain-containing protein, partial [Bacteroidota bacterium]|nr:PKD domain-containing protein [Bacteroidota bacterium]